MRGIMAELKLVVNEQKTRICRSSESTFDFLGSTIGTHRNRKTGEPYIGVCPSHERVSEVLRAITEQTGRKWGWVDHCEAPRSNPLRRLLRRGLLAVTGDMRGVRHEREMVKRLNWRLRGWANYFSLGGWNRVSCRIDQHVQRRLRQWMCTKHKVSSGGYRKWSHLYFYDNGLVRLKGRPCISS